MKESQAKSEGLEYQARIIATASKSRHPSEFTIAPIGAIEKYWPMPVGQLKMWICGRLMKLLLWSLWLRWMS